MDKKTLYHYSDVDGFFNIIKNKKLWLSGPHNLNDHQEVNWAKNKIASTFQRLEKMYAREHIEYLWLLYANNGLTPFTCSLSSEGDLLSQWRAYARDGTGVSIGFNSSLLPNSGTIPHHNAAPSASITTMQVVYDDAEQDETIETILSSALEAAKSNQNWQADDRLIYATTQLNALTTTYKNSAFREESEWRIIHTPMIMAYQNTSKHAFHSGISDIKHRTSNGKIITYFEYDFSSLIKDKIITEIILGPKCAIQNYDLNLFLAMNELEYIQIRRSSATYR
ncbi:DUF2971 domain-containing protein [Pseudomonas sp. zfem004]|uniref:DUF2971 domain-containing protein n=1 Tax=Pseudomonas sp. zfem004 TaxID=3078199 RepID=UPI002928A0AE|nr:DUF2971 domain-containing protein [Pseudomonas sp. zfem004]MDU9401847.1 DUF2971 domain-containing protein [Pseudomonas sp. zfem004]